MKISDLNTDNALDVLCEITPYISGILEDAELRLELKRKLDMGENASPVEIYAAAIRKAAKLVPVLLKTHRADVYGIVAAINSVTPEEVAEQNILKTVADITEIVTDKAFKDFFASLRNTENK